MNTATGKKKQSQFYFISFTKEKQKLHIDFNNYPEFSHRLVIQV